VVDGGDERLKFLILALQGQHALVVPSASANESEVRYSTSALERHVTSMQARDRRMTSVN
jgi:hypothetical protein